MNQKRWARPRKPSVPVTHKAVEGAQERGEPERDLGVRVRERERRKSREWVRRHGTEKWKRNSPRVLEHLKRTCTRRIGENLLTVKRITNFRQESFRISRREGNVPIKTNLEIDETLSEFRGSSDLPISELTWKSRVT